MKKWRVFFDIYSDATTKKQNTVSVVVEAGTKKLAVTRGILELNKMDEYRDRYKSLEAIEEVIE